MSGLILEALLALVILLVIVWWTMFSGRPRGELPHAQDGGTDVDRTGEATIRPTTAPKD